MADQAPGVTARPRSGCLPFALGFAAGWGAVFLAYLAWTLAGGVDRDGAIGMGLTVLVGPGVGLLAGFVALARRRPPE
jgi:hypothetical protein